MSVCRSVRCLFPAVPLPKPSAAPKRSFHASAPNAARRRRPHYPSIKAEDLKLLNQAAETQYPKFDTSETALLEKRYTPAQIAAIQAAESAIDGRDLVTQAQDRTDPWLLPYEDDLAEVDPVTDHAVKLDARDIPGSHDFRPVNNEERDEAIAFLTNENLAKLFPDGLPEGEITEETQQVLQEAMGTAMTQAVLDPRASFRVKNPRAAAALADPRHSIVMPDLPRIDNRMVRQTRRLSSEEEEDPRQKRLLQYLDWTKRQLKSVKCKTLVVHGVTNQTRMGKIRSMYYLTIAGNGNGLLGVGEGKSVEPDEGRKQSIVAAVRNMRPVARYENRTTYGTLERKVGATKVQLFSRPPGTFPPHTGP
jgi:small subunit ribosomal protein S5